MVESTENPDGFNANLLPFLPNGRDENEDSTPKVVLTPSSLSKIRNKTLLTSGQCAKALGVAPRTIVKWMDNGTLQGAFRLPNSKDRRIPKIRFVMFCLNKGIPIIPALQMERLIVAYGNVGAIPPQIGFTLVRCKTHAMLNEYTSDLNRIIQFAIGPDIPLLEAQMIAHCVTPFQPTPIIFINDDVNKDTIPKTGREINYLSSIDTIEWYNSIFYLVTDKAQDKMNHLGKKGGQNKTPLLERLADNGTSV